MVAYVPPDIGYCLQSAEDILDVTGDVVTYYYRFNETPLDDLIDNRQYPSDVGESLRSLARIYYRPYNNWYWTKANPLEQAWCVSSAGQGLTIRATEYIDHLYTKFISSCLTNSVNPTTARQQRWFDQSRSFTHVEKIFAQLARKASAPPFDLLCQALHCPAEFALLLPALDDLVETDDCCTPWVDDCTPWVGSTRRIKTHIRRKKNQKVLSKSARFLSRLIGTNDVAMFVKGESITIRGNRFAFQIKKNDILSSNHGALRITIRDNQSDIDMFGLCWYVDATPAMDQISALVMAVRTGNENDIIRIGNAFSINQAIFEHEHLQDVILEKNIKKYVDHFPVPNGDCVIPHDDALFGLYPGTTEYCQTNDDVLRSFARHASDRLLRRFSPEMRALFITRMITNIEHYPSVTRRTDCTPDIPIVPMLV